MSLDIYIDGYRPADKKFQTMRRVWIDCKSLDIDPPEEVLEFFDGRDPTDLPGVEIDLATRAGCVREYSNDDGESGYEIVVSRLPEDLQFIRVHMG